MISKSLFKNLTGLITVTTFSKFLFNMARRLIYPFAPEFARGLNVDLSAVTSAIAVNQATSLLGPVGAGFADRYGYKILMLVSLILLSIGCLAAGLIPVYSALVFCLFLSGFAKSVFDPSLQAFIGSFVPFEKRGRIIGITELAWAGSTLIGIPLAGMAIERFSWQTPFFIISLLSMVCFFIILKLMPKEQGSRQTDKANSSVMKNWRIILKQPRVICILLFAFFMSLANDNLFVIYGAWLESSYHLSLAAIGFGTIFIGVSEVAGEGCTALFSDKIGLKRSVLIGTFTCACTYLLLPIFNFKLIFVLSGLFLVFFSYEFTFVTSMSLSTELVPDLRASTMAAFYATAGLGRVCGAFSGGLVWSKFGLTGISLISGFCTFLAFFSLVLGFSRKQSNISR